MAPVRTAWHPLLTSLLRQLLGPDSFEVRDEFPLTKEPQRVDIVIIKRLADAPEPELLDTVLDTLLPHNLLHFKGPTDELEAHDAMQLMGYAYQYMNVEKLEDPSQLGLAVLASQMTPRFLKQFRALGAELQEHPVHQGVLQGSMSGFSLRCVSLEQASRQQGNALLVGVSRGVLKDPSRWPVFSATEMALFHGMAQQIRQLRDKGGELMYPGLTMAESTYEEAVLRLMGAIRPKTVVKALTPEMLAELTPEMLAGLAPEQVAAALPADKLAAALPAEQRLAGLDEAHAVLALPVSMLRALSSDYLDALPQDVQAIVKQRLASAPKSRSNKKKNR
jgi:hypothetical protein